MSYSLDHHPDGYRVSCTNLACCLFYSPYASRHGDIAKLNLSNKDGHNALRCLESIPGLSLLTSIAELFAAKCLCSSPTSPPLALTTKRIQPKSPLSPTAVGAEAGEVEPSPLSSPRRKYTETETQPEAETKFLQEEGNKILQATPSAKRTLLQRHSHDSYHLRQLTPEDALGKAYRNAQKARTEGTSPKELEKLQDLSPLRSLQSFMVVERESPWNLSFQGEADPGKCNMEETHLAQKISQGEIFAVFDGFSGDEVSKYLVTHFSVYFEAFLKESPDNVFQALQLTIHQLQNQIIAHKFTAGSAATVCFFENRTGFLWTATIGNSKAKVFGNIKEVHYVVPVSLTRNWTSKKDEARYEHLLPSICQRLHIPEPYGPLMIKSWKALNAQERRYPGFGMERDKLLTKIGTTLSRAFGQNGEGITQKPKITVYLPNPDEILVIGSKGFYNNISNLEIQVRIIMDGKTDNLAKQLCKQAILNQKQPRNTTVLIIKIAKGQPQSTEQMEQKLKISVITPEGEKKEEASTPG